MHQSRLGLLLVLTIFAMGAAAIPPQARGRLPTCPDLSGHWPGGRLVQEFHWGKGGRLRCAVLADGRGP